jgi:hypothetical protein
LRMIKPFQRVCADAVTAEITSKIATKENFILRVSMYEVSCK